MTTLETGRYQHYKGAEYRVFGTCRHSETEEVLVFYQCLYGDYSFWVRPLSMFTENVELAGESVPRFRWVQPLSVDDGLALSDGVC